MFAGRLYVKFCTSGLRVPNTGLQVPQLAGTGTKNTCCGPSWVLTWVKLGICDPNVGSDRSSWVPTGQVGYRQVKLGTDRSSVDIYDPHVGAYDGKVALSEGGGRSGVLAGDVLDDFAGAETAGADVDALRSAVHKRTDSLNIRVPAALRADMGMAHAHAKRRLLAAHFTNTCHDRYLRET